MRMFALLLLTIACSHYEEKSFAPTWVNSIRNGEETLRVTQGSKIYFRRIAGSPTVSKQTSCELVVMKAQEDMEKEFPGENLSHNVEVLFYDPIYQDCAVTLSVETRKRQVASVSEKTSDEISADEVSRILVERSETAIKFALTGLTLKEFEQFSKEEVSLNSGEGLCSAFFRTQTYSVHGLTHVCWTHNNIQGYCTSRTGQCWVRSPQ